LPNTNTPPSPANKRNPRGVAAGITLADADDHAPVPLLFVARTRQLYVRVFVRLVTVIGGADRTAILVTPPLVEVHRAV
jgi:hypothetical protein